MWIIVLYLCFSAIFPNNSQELTNYEAQTVSQTSDTKDDIYWNSSKPPVALSIRNGRNRKEDQTIPSNSESPVIYTNEWKPNIIRIPANRNRVTSSFENKNERYANQQLTSTLLLRPDLPKNDTLHSEVTERAAIPGMTIPILHFQNNLSYLSTGTPQEYAETLPNESNSRNLQNFKYFDLYRNMHNFSPSVAPLYNPSHFSLNSNVENPRNNLESKEISSNEGQESADTDPTDSNINEEIIISLPSEDHRVEQVISSPMAPYRNREFFSPLSSPYFPPYTFPPFQRNNAFRPVVPYLPNDQTFDRESGSEVHERIQEVPENENLPQSISEQLAENLSDETGASVIPSEPSAFSVAGYPIQPFGLFPSPFMYPMPNIPQPGLPLSQTPLPQPRNVQKEDTIADAFRPPSIIPEIFIRNDNLTPEVRTSTITAPAEKSKEIITTEEEVSTKIPYAFGFDMNDGKGNDQHRNEVSDISGVVTGSYGYTDVKGLYRLVKYIADKDGFHVFIQSNEPGMANSGSADVTVKAERPPPMAIAEPGVNGDLIAPGSIVESE